MIWKGETIVTPADLVNAVVSRVTSREEAQEFLGLYEASNSAARWNVGYITGYCDLPTARRLMEWFGVEHPLLGRVPADDHERAFEVGLALGERAARGERSDDLDNLERFMGVGVVRGESIQRLGAAAVGYSLGERVGQLDGAPDVVFRLDIMSAMTLCQMAATGLIVVPGDVGNEVLRAVVDQLAEQNPEAGAILADSFAVRNPYV